MVRQRATHIYSFLSTLRKLGFVDSDEMPPLIRPAFKDTELRKLYYHLMETL